ncbi:hypothetical protein Vadar_006832 [Vaccinium darrowii]|uniref:Uncharacterized protein n=1 Tax=Vaccinium darrowii TaxID=229202 RepID=A0ACB7ZIT7_9ERIC|nr:hypothetical protein Vadar_006832 [Vaccinium darrowii]
MRNLVDAWFVFGKMEERDAFSWNVLVGGYAKGGYFDDALNLYRRMLWAGVKPDVYTFPCVLRTCGGIPDLARGKEVHVHVIRHRFECEVDVVNALITMEGLEFFFMMRELFVVPNLMTITSVISGCELLGDERLGRVIHGMESKDVVSRTAMILGYEGNGLPEKVVETYNGMELEGVMLDEIAIVSVLSACASLGFLDMGIKLHELAKRTGLMSYYRGKRAH